MDLSRPVITLRRNKDRPQKRLFLALFLTNRNFSKLKLSNNGGVTNQTGHLLRDIGSTSFPVFLILKLSCVDAKTELGRLDLDVEPCHTPKTTL